VSAREQSQSPQDHLPLSHTVLRVLLVLGDGEMHGYGIMQALAEKTDGREKILPGTLYASIARMTEDGLLEEVDGAAPEESGGPKRRYYRRTELGTAVARAESERLLALVDLARAEKILPESGR
jgi:DNA-binding PadR family transcriptional regulator